MSSTKQNILSTNLFEEFFGGQPNFAGKQSSFAFPNNVRNYNIIENKDGSNTIFINALGYAKTDIIIEVVKGNLVITANKPKTAVSFLPNIDYKFKLGYTFSDEGIVASMDNGILSVTVQEVKVEEPVKKMITIN